MAHHSFKRITTNTASQLVVKLVSSISTLAATILISRFLGFAIFGSFTKIITFVSFFYLLADFGINAIFLKDYANSETQEFGNITFLRLIMGIVLAIAATGIALVLPYSAATLTGYSIFEKIGIALFSLNIIAIAATFSLSIYYQKELFYPKTVIPNVCATIIFFVFLFWGIAVHNVFIILFGFVASNILLALLLFLVIKKYFALSYKLASFSQFSTKILRQSAPIGAMLALNLVYAKADTILLSIMKPTADVGVYGFAYRIFEFLIAVPAFFSNAVYPILIDSQSNRNLFISLTKKYTGVLLLSSIVLSVIVFIASPLLTLLSANFAAAILPVRILATSLPFFFLTSLFQWIFIIKNKKGFLVGIYGCTMVLNILLNLVFIPQFSYTASAIITVVTEGIVFAGMAIYLGFL